MDRSVVSRLFVSLLVAWLSVGAVRVTLKDGRRIEGEVTQTEEGYTIKTRFGSISVAADQVVSIDEIVTPRQEFRQRLAKIQADDWQGFYELGQWAFDNNLLNEAREALGKSLQLKSDYERAQLLMRRVEARLATTTQPQTPPTATTTPATPTDEMLLSQDDIYRIRLEELRSTDRVPITFGNNVLNRFINMMQGRAEFRQPNYDRVFRAMPDVQKVIYILSYIDPDNRAIKDDIRVESDPQFMAGFRRFVMPKIEGNCSSLTCHGGDKAPGGLKLFRLAARSERADYTNFAILAGFDKGGRRMINRDRPELSLLLQYGLPPDQARYGHPSRLRIIFASTQAPDYTNIYNWIDSLAGPPHPRYNLDYRPPYGMKLDWSGLPELPPPPTAPAEQQQPY